MLWPKKNSYKEFDNEEKFLRLDAWGGGGGGGGGGPPGEVQKNIHTKEN